MRTPTILAGPAGKTVVQVYFGQDLSSRVRFSKMLLGFTKVDIPANAVDVPVKVRLCTTRHMRSTPGAAADLRGFSLHRRSHREHSGSVSLEDTAWVCVV